MGDVAGLEKRDLFGIGVNPVTYAVATTTILDAAKARRSTYPYGHLRRSHP